MLHHHLNLNWNIQNGWANPLWGLQVWFTVVYLKYFQLGILLPFYTVNFHRCVTLRLPHLAGILAPCNSAAQMGLSTQASQTKSPSASLTRPLAVIFINLIRVSECIPHSWNTIDPFSGICVSKHHYYILHVTLPCHILQCFMIRFLNCHYLLNSWWILLNLELYILIYVFLMPNT